MDHCEKWEWHSETKACTYYSVSKKEKKINYSMSKKKEKNYSVSKKEENNYSVSTPTFIINQKQIRMHRAWPSCVTECLLIKRLLIFRSVSSRETFSLGVQNAW